MPVTERPSMPDGSGWRVEARRRAGLSPVRCWTLFGAFASGNVALALAFAAGGVWPVLPYSVLELGCLAAACAWLERRGREWEALTLEDDRVIVERAAGGRVERLELPRAWLRVELEREGAGREPTLRLRSGRRSLRFGAGLPVAERVALARTLMGRLPAR